MEKTIELVFDLETPDDNYECMLESAKKRAHCLKYRILYKIDENPVKVFGNRLVGEQRHLTALITYKGKIRPIGMFYLYLLEKLKLLGEADEVDGENA